MDALEGIRILDLTRGIAGPLGVLLLAEHGADVIKVEPPGGDPSRGSPEYRVWDRSRRSVEVDLKSPEGKAQFLELVSTADVLVESFRPGAMAALGLDYDTLAEAYPALVYLSVTGYPSGSRHSSRSGWDGLVQARSGLQYEQPGWRPGPIFLHNQPPSMAAAYLVPIGILAALSAREVTGRGQHVETSLFQGAMALTTMLWIHAEHGQTEMQAAMAKTYPPGIHQRSIYECSDGWIHASGGRSTKGKSVTEILGLPDEASPGAVMALGMAGTPEAKVQLAAIQQQIADAYRSFTVAELVDQFVANGLGAEPIIPMDEILFHPQLVATGAVVEVEDPEVGPTTQLGVTVYLEKTPGRVTGPRPLLGQHTDEVFAEAKVRVATPAPKRAEGHLDHALGDFRVLDFGRAFAGPFAAMILASLGADVIKVQAPGVQFMGGAPELGCGQGKRAIAVDMKRPKGMKIAHELIARSDLVHHNMTLGVAERLGIDYETLRSIKADILYCNTFMYGPVGPLAELGGLDPMAQAAAGLEYEAGPVREGNTPLWYRFGHGDTANALSSVVGVLAAQLHRKRTGEGQPIWATLLHGAALWGSGTYRGPDGAPELARLDKAQTGLDALYRLYEAQGGWIQIAALEPEQWPALCQAVGRADLIDDDQFATPEARKTNRSALEGELESAFAVLTPLQWRRRLDGVGVPSEVAVDTQDGESWLFDEEMLDLGVVAEVHHAVHGRLRQVGQLMTFSETPGVNRLAPPVVGQDTVEIMRWLGYDDDTIVDYRNQGIIEFPGAFEA